MVGWSKSIGALVSFKKKSTKFIEDGQLYTVCYMSFRDID